MFFFPSVDEDVYDLTADFKSKNKGNDLELSEEDLLVLIYLLLEGYPEKDVDFTTKHCRMTLKEEEK